MRVEVHLGTTKIYINNYLVHTVDLQYYTVQDLEAYYMYSSIK